MDPLRRAWKGLSDAAGSLFTNSVVITKKYGGEAFSMPLIWGILLLIFALKIVLILLIIALIAGYRVSVVRRGY
jgi:hypothetical protein